MTSLKKNGLNKLDGIEMKKKKRITQDEIVNRLVSDIEAFAKRPSIEDIENLNDEYFKMVPRSHLNFIKKYGLMEILGKLRRKSHNIPEPIPSWINERFEFEK